MRLLALRMAEGRPVTDRVLGWAGDPAPNADSLPLRLAGSLQALKLKRLALSEVYPPSDPDDEALWRAINAAFDDHSDHILQWLDNPPQTNEVRRSAVILCGLTRIASLYDRPVELLELGTSGGLNLRADKYRLKLPGAGIGDANSGVVLTPDWTGPKVSPHLPLVLARSGVDLAPLDLQNSEDSLRLWAYLWPDQPERLALTTSAIQVVAGVPAKISSGDAGAWLETALATPATDRLKVVFHTVAWQYFPAATRQRAQWAMARATSPLVQLSMEADGGDGARISLTHWPEGRNEELGRADFHGRWIVWY